MSEGTSTEHLPINLAQEYRVKLGKSFTFPDKNAFHTLKYDFKPQSVDPTRPGLLKITEEEAVNVSLPVGQGESGDDYAQFRGPKKNCTKECILIIDRVTGEAILERISDTVQLKATRDSHKPVHRERSVSPLPFQTQPKAPPPKPSYSKPASSSLLNPPTKKQHGTGLSAPSSKKPKLAAKNASNVTKSDSTVKISTVNPKPGSSGSFGNTMKMEKKHSKASSQPKLGSTGGHNLLNPKLEPQGISPLRSSSNPTPPEPGAVPPKRVEVMFSSSSSSSSSGSSSSDSDSMDEMMSHESHVISQRAAIPAVHSIPTSDVPKGSSHTYSQKMSSSSLHPPQKTDTSRPLSRSSSAGLPGQPLSRAARLAFVDETSAQLLNRTSHGVKQSGGAQPGTTQTSYLPRQSKPVVPQVGCGHEVRQSGGKPGTIQTSRQPVARDKPVVPLAGSGHEVRQSGGAQPGTTQTPFLPRQPVARDKPVVPLAGGGHEVRQSDGAQPGTTETSSLTLQASARDKPVVPLVGGESSSSSSSDSDSSSGSSSSDSSSDSDEEVDREVAFAFSNPKPARQMSMSLLRSDLNLSESGSDSDL